MKLHEALAKKNRTQGLKRAAWPKYIWSAFVTSGVTINNYDIEAGDWELESLPPKQVTITKEKFEEAWHKTCIGSNILNNMMKCELKQNLGLSDE